MTNATVVNRYDRANRLLETRYTADDDTVLAAFRYTLDDLGNRLSVSETLSFSNTAHSTTVSYSYDHLYRLTSAIYTGTVSATYSYDYDPVGNLITYTASTPLTTTSESRLYDTADSGSRPTPSAARPATPTMPAAT